MKRQIIKFIIKQLAVLAPEFKARLLYKKAFGKPLNLQSPSTWNEKINHLKLNGYRQNTLVKQCADKYAVRQYIKDQGCEEILNELYFACDSVNDIPWDTLPDKFVIKGNHGSGYNLICQNKKLLNIKSAKKLIDGWMKDDYWKTYVELNYKGIQKKIIGEKIYRIAQWSRA